MDACMYQFQKILCIMMLSLYYVRSDDAVTRTVDVQSTCGRSYATSDAISFDTLYNQAYEWNNHKVEHWSYKSSTASAEMQGHFTENAQLECAVFIYYSDVDLPDFYAPHLQTFNLDTIVHVRIKNEVCRDTGGVLVEIVIISVNRIGNLYLLTRSEVNAPDTLHTVTEIKAEVPAYAMFLSDQILDSLEQSVRDKTDILSTSLCVIQSPSSPLRRA